MGAHLSEPILTKESDDGKDENLVYGVSSMQGWRNNMEDAHIHDLKTLQSGAFFAVFDGHGGSEVARYCAKNMTNRLKDLDSFKESKYLEALTEVYHIMDNDMLTDTGKIELDTFKDNTENAHHKMLEQQLGIKLNMSDNDAGCTAVSVLIKDGHYHVANAGDSRIVLCRGGTTIEMSQDHGPDLQSEIDRIHAAGGEIENGRVNGNLNLTRAIGDFCYKKNSDIPAKDQIICAEPDVESFPIHADDEFLVLACDGIWESKSSREVVEFVKERLDKGMSPVSSVVEELLDELVSPNVAETEGIGCDNMTCIVVDLASARRTKGALPEPSATHEPRLLNPEQGTAIAKRAASMGGSSPDGDEEMAGNEEEETTSDASV